MPGDDWTMTHTTHVEHDPAGWYFWCEALDCDGDPWRRRHPDRAEAESAARWHELEWEGVGG